MKANNRVNGWLGDQLVFSMYHKECDETFFTVITLITVATENGPRVEVYKDGMRQGKSLQLAAQQASIVAVDAIYAALGATDQAKRGDQEIHVGETIATTRGRATLIAIC
jgi:hypothetical protein